MNDTVELRYEIKLMCAARYLHQARAWIRLHPEGFRITYPSRTVSNIYLDSNHLNSLRANLAGVSRRQKLRLRWYGLQFGPEHTNVEEPVLELKYKSNLLGGKRRQLLDCMLDLTLPWTEILVDVSAHAGSYWQPWLSAVTQPTLINHYQREYFASPDGEIRATLDHGLVAFDQRFSRRPNQRARLIQRDRVIIELKAPLGLEERLERCAVRFPIRRGRSSKYVDSLMGLA